MAENFMARGGGWVLAQFILMGTVLASGPMFRGTLPVAGVDLPGWLAVGAGAMVGLAGGVRLGRNRTVFPKPTEEGSLVQEGIYGWVRHPLYVSVILLSFGWGLLWTSLVALFGAGAVWCLLNLKARREERWLTERYPGYPDYCRRVGRFFPKLKSR